MLCSGCPIEFSNCCCSIECRLFEKLTVDSQYGPQSDVLQGLSMTTYAHSVKNGCDYDCSGRGCCSRMQIGPCSPMIAGSCMLMSKLSGHLGRNAIRCRAAATSVEGSICLSACPARTRSAKMRVVSGSALTFDCMLSSGMAISSHCSDQSSLFMSNGQDVNSDVFKFRQGWHFFMVQMAVQAT